MAESVTEKLVAKTWFRALMLAEPLRMPRKLVLGRAIGRRDTPIRPQASV